MTTNTRDLSKFGNRELAIAADLLLALTEPSKNRATRLTSPGVALELNTYSGVVFLVDEELNVAMLNDDKLEDFFVCPECGEEGFKEELQMSLNQCCKIYLMECK